MNGIIRRQRWPGDLFYGMLFLIPVLMCKVPRDVTVFKSWDYTTLRSLSRSKCFGFLLWKSFYQMDRCDQDECIYLCVTGCDGCAICGGYCMRRRTFVSVTGVLLILLGLIVSQKKINQKIRLEVKLWIRWIIVPDPRLFCRWSLERSCKRRCW